MTLDIAWYEVLFFFASGISSIFNFAVAIESTRTWLSNLAKNNNYKQAKRVAEIGAIYSINVFLLTMSNTVIGGISFFAPNRTDLTPFEMSFVIILTGFAVLIALGSLRIHFLLRRIFS